MTAIAWASRRISRAGELVLLLAALAWSAAVRAEEWPQPRNDFMAEYEMVAGALRIDMTLWYQRGKERREMVMQGQPQVIIARPDLEKIWMLQSGMAMEMAYSPEMAGMGTPETMARMNPVKEGREAVNGVMATRYRYDGAGPMGARAKGLIWVSDEGVLLRLEGESLVDGAMMPNRTEIKSLEIAAQDPALFELPAGTQVIKMQ